MAISTVTFETIIGIWFAALPTRDPERALVLSNPAYRLTFRHWDFALEFLLSTDREINARIALGVTDRPCRYLTEGFHPIRGSMLEVG